MMSKPSTTPAIKPVPFALTVVQPSAPDAKDGCLHCPLLPMSVDFPAFAKDYKRDADKILVKLKEPHVVRSRNVSDRPWEPVDILFAGEAPGGDEDKAGKPFIGRSGKLLRETVKAIDTVSQLRVAYTNTVRCRPPLNRDPGKAEIAACIPDLRREIEARQPKVVVPLGNFGLEFFTGRKGITTACGHLMRCVQPGLEHLKVVPCFHPAYVLRADHEFDKFANAIEFAGKVFAGDYEEKQGEGEYFVLDDAQDVIDLMAALRSDRLNTAFDTETGGSTPFQTKFPPLLCFSFSNAEGVGYTVPWDHADSPWSLHVPEPTLEDVPDQLTDRPRKGTKAYKAWVAENEPLRLEALAGMRGVREARLARARAERPAIAKALRDFFTDPNVPRVAQNGKFDVQHIRKALGVDVAFPVRDTMLRHLTLDDRRGVHGLENLSYSYTGMGGYHREIDAHVERHLDCNPRKSGSYANIPGEMLFRYAAQDCDSTIRAFNAMGEEPEYREDAQFRTLSDVFFPFLTRTLAEMEYAGACIDVGVVKEMERELKVRTADVTARIMAIPQVRQFVADQIVAGKAGRAKNAPFDFNPGSDPQLRKILFDYCGLRPTEMTDAGFALLAARFARLHATDKSLEFKDVVEGAIEARDWGCFSTKADVLHEYERQGVDLATLILEFREANKLLTTYVEPIYERLDENSCVHGSFHPGGATTGRLASSAPNLQNIPGYAKRAFVSRFGNQGLILSADYSQIELKFACSLFNEPRMIAAYRAGEDLHSLTAAILAGLKPAQYAQLPDKEKKKWRLRAKRVNFGIVYGVGATGIVNTLRKDGVFITFEEATEIRNTFKAGYPGLIAGMEALENETRKTGQVRSFTGYVRRLPEVMSSDNNIVARALRQAVNFPVQHGAGFTTLIAMCLVDNRMREAKCRSKLILTVHDQIAIDAHVDEAMPLAEMVKDVMENVPKLSDEVIPGLDWSWLQVPITADFDTGVSWGQAVEFDPYAVVRGGAEPDGPLFFQDEDGKTRHRKPSDTDELWELIAYKADA